MIKHLEDVGGYYEGDFYSPLFEADMIISLENNTFIHSNWFYSNFTQMIEDYNN